LIDRINFSGSLPDDQIGTHRSQGAFSEPGSIEYNGTPPPAPSPPVPVPPPSEPSDETGNCDPFAGLEISVHQLNINPETMIVPIYLRFPAAVPGIGEDGIIPFWGTLGGQESNLCNQQGFEDRLYCMFTLQPAAPGTLQNLEIYMDDCPDPVVTIPKVTIPNLPSNDQPGTSCNKDLEDKACTDAGGFWSKDVPDPFCLCP